MPRQAKGPYLRLRKREGAQSLWYIVENIDGKKRWTATGIGAEHREDARQALADYLSKDITKPSFGEQNASVVSVAEVMILYATDRIPKQKHQREAGDRMQRLVEFFGEMPCDLLTPATTDGYVRWRCHLGDPGKDEPPRERRPIQPQSARRELADLQAALNYAWKSRKLDKQIPITLPDKAPPRERWLTVSEAARLLLGSLGFILSPYSDIRTRTEGWAIWRREKAVVSRHLAKFILIGLRTGTRHDAILGLGWHQHLDGGYFDIERKIMFRAAPREVQTTKKKPPIPIPRKLIRHLPRWKRASNSLFVVSAPGYEDEKMQRVKKGFRSAVDRAGLDHDVTPHILRHTCVTWLMQKGVPAWEVAGFVGMSVQMVEENYGHHSPHFLRNAADA